MSTPLRESEQFPQRPAHPKVLLNAGRGKAELHLRLFTEAAASVLRECNKGIHGSASRGGDLAHHIRYPLRSIVEILQQRFLLIGIKSPAQFYHNSVVHMAF